MLTGYEYDMQLIFLTSNNHHMVKFQKKGGFQKKFIVICVTSVSILTNVLAKPERFVGL